MKGMLSSGYKLLAVIISAFLLIALIFVSSPTPAAAESLELATSAQVYEAFRGMGIESFTKKSGVDVKIGVYTSDAAVQRLVNGVSDVAAIASRLENRYKDQGFVEFPFCKDSLAVITNAQVQVKDLSLEELRGIFSGMIKTWNEVGGQEKPITVIIPAQDTAAYRNFSSLVMGGQDINYEILTRKSTDVVEAVRHYSTAISFINQAPTRGTTPGAKIVKIDGRAPGDPGYPYFEVFSLVTRGQPAGSVKQIVDYARSDEFMNIIKERGMIPYK